MTRTAYTAFYPSRPFWAGSKPDLRTPAWNAAFHAQMAEEVLSTENERFALKIARDGRVSMRVVELEVDRPADGIEPIQNMMQRWGAYLDYLNAFYLLLDSATIEVDKMSYFNLHEITHRDAFRVTYEDGKFSGESIAMESLASVFQMGRHPSSYSADLPIDFDTRLQFRQVVSVESLTYALGAFTKTFGIPGSQRPLSGFAKSLAEYKVGNYETSIVLSWFIIEATLNTLWKDYLTSQNSDMGDGRIRINRERRDYLTGRDYTASVLSNLLELNGTIENALFLNIDAARGYRNKIVHAKDFRPSATESQLVLRTAQEMIKRVWSISFEPNMGYSVSGM
jgi:hypothetical protein